MRRMNLAGAALAVTVMAGGVWAAVPAPQLDKVRLESFLRYAEGYVKEVTITIDDPKASAIPGYFDVTVHLTNGERRLDKHYFVTGDAKSVISGTVWDLTKAPFASTMSLLPKDGYSFGPADAPVKMVVFSDFQCPYCSEFAKTMREQLVKEYDGKVQVIFEDFPLSFMHPWARAAAEGAHCLGDQKVAAFWAFHDSVFENQKSVTAENLREKTLLIAKEQQLDEGKVASCLDSHAAAAAIDKSIALARLLQVEQTPTFFVNGRQESGAMKWPGLKSLIEFELNRPKEFVAKVEKCCEIEMPKLQGRE